MEMLEGIVNCIYSSGVEDDLKTSAQDKCQESTISFVPVMLSQSQERACLGIYSVDSSNPMVPHGL